MQPVMRPVIPNSKKIEKSVLSAISKCGHTASSYDGRWGPRLTVPSKCLPMITDQVHADFAVQIEPIDVAGKTVLGIAGHVQARIGAIQQEQPRSEASLL